MPAAKIGVLSEVRLSPKIWSGTSIQMVEAFRRAGAEVRELSPVWSRRTRILRKSGQAMGRVFGVDPQLNATSRTIARAKARTAERRMQTHGLDFLFAPAGANLIPYLRTDPPIVYASDATIRLLSGYYDAYAHLTAKAQRRAEALERTALQRADLLLYSTHWAAQSAITDYGVEPERVLVHAYGPNLAGVPKRLPSRKPDDPYHLLFCGVDWHRKGGDIALATHAALRARGLPVRLTIVGAVPPPTDEPRADVTVIPHLSKADPEEANFLATLFASADLFFLPTRADCFPAALLEAAAYGLPSVTTDTGGVEELVSDELTGRVLPLAAGAADYAAVIADLLEDPARRAAMGEAAHERYRLHMNWQAWAEAVLRRAALL